MSTGPGFIGIPQRLEIDIQQWNTLQKALLSKLRVACPGIIQSFDSAKQTAVIQLAVTEQLLVDGTPTPTTIPLLLDVPVVMPRAGNFVVAMPVQQGDECLVIFGDMDYSAWWQNGGVQNQIMKRRHDLSDAIAVLGLWSQPNVVENFPTSSMQLRSLDGTVKIELTGDTINITAPNVNINGQTLAVNMSTSADIEASGNTKVEGRKFTTHEHTGVQSGGSNSGGVV